MGQAFLVVNYSNRRELLGLVRKEAGQTRLFVPTADAVAPQARVRLKVTFNDSDRSFRLTGRVMEAEKGGDFGPGFQLVLQTPQEERALGFVLAFCIRNQEAARRCPVTLECTVMVGPEKVRGELKDVSMTGAFIAARPHASLREGTGIELQLSPGVFGMGETRMKAEVIWVGEKQGTLGFGAHFDGAARDEVRALLRKHGLGGKS